MTENQRMRIVNEELKYDITQFKNLNDQERVNLTIQFKKDETMKWVRKLTKLYYFISVFSIVSVVIWLLISFFSSLNLPAM